MAEFETSGDIRSYLQRWQDINPKVLDPVQEFDAATTSDLQSQSLQVLGIMLNGQEPGDAEWTSSDLTKRDDLDTSEEFEGEHLEPGDLVVRLFADGVFKYAVYVQSLNRQKQFYTQRGNWRICSSGEVDYVVKGFAPPELLEPIKPYFPNSLTTAMAQVQSVPEGGLPRPLGAPLLKMMANFQKHVLEFYRTHSNLLDNLYDLVADDAEFLHMTLQDLATKALGIDDSELNSVNLLAVHKAVRDQPFLVEKDSTSLFSSTYLVQPKRIAKMVHQVTEWVHEHQQLCIMSVLAKDVGYKEHPMRLFIQKAQRLVRLSRKFRSPTIMSCVGPSSQQFQPGADSKMAYRKVLAEKFTPCDQAIIEYLQLYAIPSVIMPSGTLRSTASHIMRATGMYDTLGLSSSSTRLFLQELGVIAPWENVGLLDQTLLLPGHEMSLLHDMKWEEIEEACENISGSLTDSMQHLRKDWGDLPVYCVDDASAQEIDDGVSLERIPGSDDTFWLRIHVANPTAFLKHDNPIMQYAASRLATTYAPERTYPIFPTSLTQSHFSLASGRPTLTFSAKMNLQGEILDTEVTNGVIRNVISLTHSTLRGFLDPEAKKPQNWLTVGNKLDPSPETPGKTLRETLSPEDKETFTILRQLMLGFHTQRKENGAIDLQALRPDTSISVRMGTAPAKPYKMQVTEGSFYVGDPIIQLRMHDFDPHEVPDESKNNLISLLMNVAGHIAGRFCAARNIPAVFDGTWYDPEYGRVTNENVAEFGGETFFRLALPKAISASAPVHHHILGLDAYVKSTSPLRRYNDVIAHYQIEAALRYEHEHGCQLDAADNLPEFPEAGFPVGTESTSEAVSTSEIENTSDSESHTQDRTSPLPFTQPDLDAHILTTQPLKTRLREVSAYSSQHWACMLLFRAFYFGECDLPSSFPVLLRAPRLVPEREGTVYSGIITNLGVACAVSVPENCVDKDSMEIFGLVDASITAVDMASLEVRMEAKGLIRRFERKGEWA